MINKIENEITEIDKLNITEIIEQTIVENINNILKNVTEKDICNNKIESIGIAVPGTVKDGSIIKCVNLGIKNYNIVEKLNKLLNQYIDTPINIKLQNDAKCAAIAENKYGALQEYDDSIFLTLGTGIGGAVIKSNELLEGKLFSGYEFGHMIINPNGPICNCGKNGCFELYGSMKKFKDMLKQKLELNEFTTGEQLFEILKYGIILNKNREKINEVIETFTWDLAVGISNLINIFEPEAIGIGGSFSYFEEFLLQKLKNNIICGNLLFNPRDDIIIKSALLKNDAGIIGASML